MLVWSGTLISEMMLEHWSKYKDMLLEPACMSNTFPPFILQSASDIEPSIITA